MGINMDNNMRWTNFETKVDYTQKQRNILISPGKAIEKTEKELSNNQLSLAITTLQSTKELLKQELSDFYNISDELMSKIMTATSPDFMRTWLIDGWDRYFYDYRVLQSQIWYDNLKGLEQYNSMISRREFLKSKKISLENEINNLDLDLLDIFSKEEFDKDLLDFETFKSATTLIGMIEKTDKEILWIQLKIISNMRKNLLEVATKERYNWSLFLSEWTSWNARNENDHEAFLKAKERAYWSFDIDNPNLRFEFFERNRRWFEWLINLDLWWYYMHELSMGMWDTFLTNEAMYSHHWWVETNKKILAKIVSKYHLLQPSDNQQTNKGLFFLNEESEADHDIIDNKENHNYLLLFLPQYFLRLLSGYLLKSERHILNLIRLKQSSQTVQSLYDKYLETKDEDYDEIWDRGDWWWNNYQTSSFRAPNLILEKIIKLPKLTTKEWTFTEEVRKILNLDDEELVNNMELSFDEFQKSIDNLEEKWFINQTQGGIILNRTIIDICDTIIESCGWYDEYLKNTKDCIKKSKYESNSNNHILNQKKIIARLDGITFNNEFIELPFIKLLDRLRTIIFKMY